MDLSALKGELGELTSVEPAGKDTNFQYLFFLCHKSVEEASAAVLQKYGFSRMSFRGMTGTAAENDKKLSDALAENERQTEEKKAYLSGFGDSLREVELYVDLADQDCSREEAKERLLDTAATFYLTGWVPADDEKRLKALLDHYTCAWETTEPTQEEYPQVPVKLKNGWFARPLNMVTDMYSLPAYGTVDPNPLMAPFFILFYGMMMADMGYGLIMMIVAAVVMKRTKPKGPTVRYMFPLLGLCGVSTFLWGAVTGGFFGDLIPQMAKLIAPNSTLELPALFSPLDDAVPVLIGALALGVAQIFTGMAVSMYRKIKQGEVLDALCNEGAWYLVFLLVAIGVLGVLPLKTALIAIVVLLVLTQGYGKKGVVGKIMGIFGSLYNNITGYFSDILSYSRLMALMLAGAVVAQVFNQLGAMTGNIVIFFIVAMVGNALNFALNILGCYVHDMRLQCLEFFGRFYEDGGKAFRPLDITTKYVDVIEE
jgi:V/A-type H+-transporting ATPase subunit I